MAKPRLLDLFCGAGGAARGYQQAGFYVVGVDIVPQGRYAGDEFIQADALTFPLEGFDAIHASPVCKRWTMMTRNLGGWEQYPDQLTPTRERLHAHQLAPWVIENVPGAPLRPDYRLCGCMFGLRNIRRERWFETSWHGFSMLPGHDHSQPSFPITGHGMTAYSRAKWGRELAPNEKRQAMGVDWYMNTWELADAIPPAYTRFIGEQLLAHLEAAA